MSEISAAARQELVQAVDERYREGTPAAKRRILDEFVALTRYHRKNAIRLLNGGTDTAAVTTRGRQRGTGVGQMGNHSRPLRLRPQAALSPSVAYRRVGSSSRTCWAVICPPSRASFRRRF
jgi:hypothetical protein